MANSIEDAAEAKNNASHTVAAVKGAAKDAAEEAQDLADDVHDAAQQDVKDAKSRFAGAVEDARAGVSALKEEAKNRGAEYGEKAKQRAAEIAEQAKNKAASLADDGKRGSSDTLAGLGRLVAGNAGKIEEKLGQRYGDYARTAARHIEDTATRLGAKDLSELGEDARGFVRKSPGLALGMAAVAGFALAALFRGGKGSED